MASVMIQRCPICQAQVKEGMARCRDCGNALSGEMPTVPPSESNHDLPLLSQDGKLYSRCPECGKKIKTQVEMAGMLIKCPRCDGPVRLSRLPDQHGSSSSSSYSGTSRSQLSSTSHVGQAPAASGTFLPTQSTGHHAGTGGPSQAPQYFAAQAPGQYPSHPQVAFPGPASPSASSAAAGYATPAHEFQTPVPPTAAGSQSSAAHHRPNPSQTSGLLSGVEVTRLHASCAACGKRVNAASAFAGHKVACPRCGEMIQLPGEAPEKRVSSTSTFASSSAAMSSSQSQSIVMSAHLLRTVEAVLELPATVPETPADEIKPLPKKTLKKHLDTIAEAAADPRSSRKDAAIEGVQAIAASHDVSAAPELINYLQQAEGTLKLRLIAALGELHCPESFEVVVRRLVSAHGPELTVCIQALGALGDTRAVLPILYAIQKYPDQRIRGFDAIVAMGKPVMSELSRIAADAAEDAVLFSIAEMLSRFPGACPVDTFSRLMSHPSTTIRQRAAESLANVADGNAVNMLIKALDDDDAVVRMFAAQGLRLAPSAVAAKPLLKAIDDPDRDVRLAALGALSECNQQAVKPALLKRADDPDVEVAIVAAEGLAKLGDASAVPRLIDILETQPTRSDEGFALRIVEGFRKLKDKRTTLPLLNLLLCDDATLRLRAVESLGQGSDRSCRPSLEKLLKYDPSDEVRMAAAKALGDLGDPDAREALQAALNDQVQVRLKAVIALGQLRSKESLPALQQFLDDPSPQVKYQILRAMGEIRDPSAIPAIEPLVESDDEMLRRAALKALQELGDKRDESNIRKSIKKKTQDEQKVKAKTPGKKFSLFDLVPAPVLGVIESLRYSRAAVLSILGVVAVIAVAAIWFSGGGGTSHGPVIRAAVRSLSISPDGRFVIAGRTRGLLEIWDIASQEVAGTSVDIPTDYVAFGPDGQSLLAIGRTTVTVAPVDDGWPGEPTVITELGNPVIDMDVNFDHSFAVTLCSDQLIYRWNLGSPQAESPLKSEQTLMAVAISNDGTQVVGATEQGSLVIWSFDTGQIVAETQTNILSKVTALAFQQDGPLVAVGTGAGELYIWDPTVSRAPHKDESSRSSVARLAFPPGGEVIVGRLSGEIQRFQVADKSLISFANSLDVISAMSLSGEHIAIGSDEMTEILLVSRVSGTVEHTLDE